MIIPIKNGRASTRKAPVGCPDWAYIHLEVGESSNTSTGTTSAMVDDELELQIIIIDFI